MWAADCVGLDSLSDRELEIAMLLPAGLTYAEVADRLCVSVRTVHSHVASAFDKTKARNQAHLAALAVLAALGWNGNGSATPG